MSKACPQNKTRVCAKAVVSFGTEHRVRSDGLQIPPYTALPCNCYVRFDVPYVRSVYRVQGTASTSDHALASATQADASCISSVPPISRILQKDGRSADAVKGSPSATVSTEHKPPQFAPQPCKRIIIPIPSEAMGRVIGARRVAITFYRNTPGISFVDLEKAASAPGARGHQSQTVGVTLNSGDLIVRGSPEAVETVRREVALRIARSSTMLHNQSRKIHSWTLSPNGRMRTPGEVHKTGRPEPRTFTTGINKNFHAARKVGKKKDLLRERANGLRLHAPSY